MLDLFRSDVFITLAAILNLLSLAAVAVALWREIGGQEAVPAPSPAAVTAGPGPVRPALVPGPAHGRGASSGLHPLG